MECFETPDQTDQDSASSQATNASNPNYTPAQASATLRSGGIGAQAAFPAALQSQRATSSVLQLDCKPTLAFATFAGKVYANSKPQLAEANKADDMVTINDQQQQQYEQPQAVTAASFESPIDRFNRLKHEIYQFQSELKSVKRSDAGTNSNTQNDQDNVYQLASLLSSEVASLTSELDSLSSDAQLQSLLNSEVESRTDLIPISQPATDLNKLIDEIKLSKTPSGVAAPPIQSAVSTASAASPLPPFASLAALEKRLALLERTLGTNQQNPSTALQQSLVSRNDATALLQLSNSSYPDVCSGLASLHAKLSLLDAHKQESITKTIKAILADLSLIESQTQSNSTVQSQKTSSSSAAAGGSDASTHLDTQRIAQLWQLVQKWDAQIGALPLLVQRLQSLHSLHSASAHALQRLDAIEQQNDQMTRLLREDQAMLEKLSLELPTQLTTINNNLTSLQQRVQALSAKAGK